MRFAILPLLCAFLLAGCAQHSITGNGTVSTESRKVAGFSSVEIDVPLNAGINVQPGAALSVSISGDQNLLSYIRTEVKEGTLRIFLPEIYEIDTKTPLEASITMPMLQGLDVSGSGKAIVHGSAKADDFSIDASGSADIIIDSVFSQSLSADLSGAGSLRINGGRVSSCEYDISGSGDVFATPLSADSVSADLSGAGSLHVTALRYLESSVSGAGDVSYQGSPVLQTEISGAGKVHTGR